MTPEEKSERLQQLCDLLGSSEWIACPDPLVSSPALDLAKTIHEADPTALSGLLVNKHTLLSQAVRVQDAGLASFLITTAHCDPFSLGKNTGKKKKPFNVSESTPRTAYLRSLINKRTKTVVFSEIDALAHFRILKNREDVGASRFICFSAHTSALSMLRDSDRFEGLSSILDGRNAWENSFLVAMMTQNSFFLDLILDHISDEALEALPDGQKVMTLAHMSVAGEHKAERFIRWSRALQDKYPFNFLTEILLLGHTQKAQMLLEQGTSPWHPNQERMPQDPRSLNQALVLYCDKVGRGNTHIMNVLFQAWDAHGWSAQASEPHGSFIEVLPKTITVTRLLDVALIQWLSRHGPSLYEAHHPIPGVPQAQYFDTFLVAGVFTALEPYADPQYRQDTLCHGMPEEKINAVAHLLIQPRAHNSGIEDDFPYILTNMTEKNIPSHFMNRAFQEPPERFFSQFVAKLIRCSQNNPCLSPNMRVMREELALTCLRSLVTRPSPSPEHYLTGMLQSPLYLCETIGSQQIISESENDLLHRWIKALPFRDVLADQLKQIRFWQILSKHENYLGWSDDLIPDFGAVFLRIEDIHKTVRSLYVRITLGHTVFANRILRRLQQSAPEQCPALFHMLRLMMVKDLFVEANTTETQKKRWASLSVLQERLPPNTNQPQLLPYFPLLDLAHVRTRSKNDAQFIAKATTYAELELFLLRVFKDQRFYYCPRSSFIQGNPLSLSPHQRPRFTHTVTAALEAHFLQWEIRIKYLWELYHHARELGDLNQVTRAPDRLPLDQLPEELFKLILSYTFPFMGLTDTLPTDPPKDSPERATQRQAFAHKAQLINTKISKSLNDVNKEYRKLKQTEAARRALEAPSRVASPLPQAEAMAIEAPPPCLLLSARRPSEASASAATARGSLDPDDIESTKITKRTRLE